ncbi:MAG: hypothetical protein HF975_04190 [ANME-2 cluster archaeon]|nr:hypothetical protein [ANME-2 cluster archaeon]
MELVTCLQGTLGLNGQKYHRGDIFEVNDEMAEHLLEHGLVTVAIPEPEPIPEPEKEPDFGVVTPNPAALTDLSLMTVREVTELVKQMDDRPVLEAWLEAERDGSNRKTVVEALETKLADQ